VRIVRWIEQSRFRGKRRIYLVEMQHSGVRHFKWVFTDSYRDCIYIVLEGQFCYALIPDMGQSFY